MGEEEGRVKMYDLLFREFYPAGEPGEQVVKVALLNSSQEEYSAAGCQLQVCHWVSGVGEAQRLPDLMFLSGGTSVELPILQPPRLSWEGKVLGEEPQYFSFLRPFVRLRCHSTQQRGKP